MMPIDLVKRFSSTPLATTLALNGMVVRVATNDPVLLNRLLAAFSEVAGSDETPIANLRIIVEDDDVLNREFNVHSFGYGGLMFAKIAHGSFLASDRQAGCGISFVERRFIQDKQLFEQCFWPAFVFILRNVSGATF